MRGSDGVRINASPQPPITDPKTYREERRSEGDLGAQREMAKWAFWMLAATGVGVITTGIGIFYLASTLAEARRSSDAAMIMAKAMIDIELPILHARWSAIRMVGVEKPVGEERGFSGWYYHGQPEKHSVVTTIPFRNFGRTPAFLTSISIGYAATNRLPDIPIYTRYIALEESDVVRPEPQEDPLELRVYMAINLEDHEVRSLKAGDGSLWLYFVVHYRDFMHRSHDAGFCLRWDKRLNANYGTHGFAADGDPPPPAYVIRT